LSVSDGMAGDVSKPREARNAPDVHLQKISSSLRVHRPFRRLRRLSRHPCSGIDFGSHALQIRRICLDGSATQLKISNKTLSRCCHAIEVSVTGHASTFGHGGSEPTAAVFGCSIPRVTDNLFQPASFSPPCLMKFRERDNNSTYIDILSSVVQSGNCFFRH